MPTSKSIFSQSVISALKDTIVKVFWKKDDLRELLEVTGVQRSLIDAQNWDLYKYKIVSPIIDALNRTEDGIGPLRAMLHETLSFKDGKHLLWLPDGQQKRREAEEALNNLRDLVKTHDDAKQSEKEEKESLLRRRAETDKYRAFNSKLADLKASYEKLCVDPDEQGRGFSLEIFLNELFSLFDLSPKSPFRRIGEQIDGAFALDRDHFLLEAKWQRKPVNLADLKVFDGTVESSLDNTLGLFISIEGFSSEAIEGYVLGRRPRLICMDGSDLYLVLDGRIDLVDLLQRKKDIAVQKRLINATAADIISGKY